MTMVQALSMVPGATIFVILRAGQKEHLEEFRKGRIRFRDLGYYSSLESKGRVHHDGDEQVAGVYQADQIKLKFTAPNGATFTASAENGLVGQVMTRAQKPRMICCFHAIHSGEWTNREFSVDKLPEYREYLLPPARMSEYGDHVWVLSDGNAFQQRLLAAAKRDHLVSLRAELVRYVDFQTVHGTIPSRLQAFVKSSQFADEREFRMEVRAATPVGDPFTWEIGDLSDISVVMPLEEFSKGIQILPPSD
jgi:hypothetical protein